MPYLKLRYFGMMLFIKLKSSVQIAGFDNIANIIY